MKNKTRRLVFRRYAVLLLLSGLNLLYLYFGDWMLGYGLGNIAFTFNYLLYTPAEKLVLALMLLCLIVPDIKQWITGRQPDRGGER